MKFPPPLAHFCRWNYQRAFCMVLGEKLIWKLDNFNFKLSTQVPGCSMWGSMYNDGTGMSGGVRQGLLTSHWRRSVWCKLAPYCSPASLPRQEVVDPLATHTASTGTCLKVDAVNLNHRTPICWKIHVISWCNSKRMWRTWLMMYWDYLELLVEMSESNMVNSPENAVLVESNWLGI